jgi:hypothetical protein
VVSIPFLSFSTLNIVYVSDSLETILSHISTRVTSVIDHGICLEHLDFLLEFLAAWEKRPVYLTPMAYQWCSAISEAAGRLGVGEPPVEPPSWKQIQYLPDQLSLRIEHRLRFQPRDLAHLGFSEVAEEGFSVVGPGCDPVRMDNTSDHTHICPQDLIPFHYVRLLPVILEIGFRLAGPGHGGLALHTFHREWTFKGAFSNWDDESIADAATVWIIGGDQTPPGSFVRYFAEHMGRSTPFSPRLRQVAIRVIERFWCSELEASELEIVRLLDRLAVDVGDIVEKYPWVQLLVGVIRLSAGPESLSSHYWRLLGKLVQAEGYAVRLAPRDVEVMRLLEGAGDWERLEDWTVVVWLSEPQYNSMEDVKQVTLKLLLQRPSALARFENVCRTVHLHARDESPLQRICNNVRLFVIALACPKVVRLYRTYLRNRTVV